MLMTHFLNVKISNRLCHQNEFIAFFIVRCKVIFYYRGNVSPPNVRHTVRSIKNLSLVVLRSVEGQLFGSFQTLYLIEIVETYTCNS